MKKFQSVRGMKDILPVQSKAFRSLENILISCANQYGYQEIRTPILEETDLFIKSIGNGTDIVEKEMFTFTDSKKNSFSMRPEGTASCARAIIENSLNESINRLWYLGPFFRHERPQKGRYRQFHQFGAELIGIENYEADVEIISMVEYIWNTLDINPLLKLNTIGNIDDRKKYIDVLVKYFMKYKNDFSESEENKIKLNPLRILDSKNEKIFGIINSAPKISGYISNESKKHFDNVLDTLNKKNISFEVDEKLVRGLDYYNKTVFEYVDTFRQTQNTICAGGRYDFLFENLCTNKLPALGFAIGLERLIEYLEYNVNLKKNYHFFIAVLNENDYLYSQKVADIIRKISKKYVVSSSYNYSNLKSLLKKANKSSSDYCVIIGEEESKDNSCQIKDMNTGNQEKIKIENIQDYLDKCINNRKQK